MTNLVVSVLVLDVLSHEPDGIDCLLKVRLLLQLARVPEPAVKPAGVSVTLIAVHCHPVAVHRPVVAVVATVGVHGNLSVWGELVQLESQGGLQM